MGWIGSASESLGRQLFDGAINVPIRYEAAAANFGEDDDAALYELVKRRMTDAAEELAGLRNRVQPSLRE